jgi:hypothetical protein
MPAHRARRNRGRKSVKLLAPKLHFMTEQTAPAKGVASQRPFRFAQPDRGCESYRPGLQSKGSAQAEPMLRCRADFAARCEALGAAAIKLPSPDNSSLIDHQRSTRSRVRVVFRLSDIEPQFVCKICCKRGADVRPQFNRREWEQRHEKSFAGNHRCRRSHLLGARAFCDGCIRVFDVSDPGELG